MKKTYEHDKKKKTDFQQRLIDLRKEKGLTGQQLAAALQVSRDCIVQWENDETRQPALDKLILLADFYGVSLDYLLGRSCCRSVDNEYIQQQLGLSDKAINQLKGFKAHDEMFRFTNDVIGKDYAFLDSYDLRLPFINCLITSDKLRQFINTMFLYILPDKFQRLVVKFNDLQLAEIPKDKLFLSTEKDLNDNVPFEMDSLTLKTFFQQKLGNILDEISKDYKKSLGQQDTKK